MHPVHYQTHQRHMQKVCKALHYISILQECGYAVVEAERAWRLRVPADCLARGACRAMVTDPLEWATLGVYCQDDGGWLNDCWCPCHTL